MAATPRLPGDEVVSLARFAGLFTCIFLKLSMIYLHNLEKKRKTFLYELTSIFFVIRMYEVIKYTYTGRKRQGD